MFSEPQSVTVNAVAKSLPRVSFGDAVGTFENVTTGHRLRISHSVGKRNRRTVRLDVTKTTEDPLLDGVSREYSESIYLVIDHPKGGFTALETEQNAQGLVDWLDVVGNLTKVINGES
jgi:hypothetical protein